MKKYYCDRCGKDIGGNLFIRKIRAYEINEHRIHLTTHEYQLCTECHQKISDFIENKNNLEGENK